MAIVACLLAAFTLPVHAAQMCPVGSSYPELFDDAASATSAGSDNSTAGCFVQWGDVEKHLASYQLVDIRHAQHYEDIHLTASINIPPQHIKTKTFLHDRKILLIAYGFEHQSLNSLCNELRQDGFTQTAILRGGISAALRNGARANTRAPHHLVRQMSPDQLVTEYFADGLHVIVENEDLKVVLQDFDVKATYLPIAFDSQAWIGAARRVQMDFTSGGELKRPLVVVTEKGPLTTAAFANEHDFWQVSVNADELISFLDRSEWTKLARHQLPGQFQCPAL